MLALLPIPVSTTTHSSPSLSAQRFMWSNPFIGKSNLNQKTPSAISVADPDLGASSIIKFNMFEANAFKPFIIQFEF